MSVIGFAQEAPDSPEGDFVFGKQVVTRRFKVQTSSELDGPGTVSFAPGIPFMFQPYFFGAEFHPFCLVRRIVPRRLAPGSLFWEVVVTYETPDVKEHGGGLGSTGRGGDVRQGDSTKEGTGVDNPAEYQNPTLEVPEVETHFETQQQPIYGLIGRGVTVTAATGSPTVTWPTNNYNISWVKVGDNVTLSGGGSYLQTTVTSIDNATNIVTLATNWNGASGPARFIDLAFRPISASNGEPFVPPPTMDASKLILTITRNEPITAPHPALSALYQDAVNSDVFWGANPGVVKVANIQARRETRQIVAANGSRTFAYLRVSYTFHFKGSGWDVQLLDKGTWYWSQPNKSRDPAQTTPAKKQRFMSADGQPIDGLLDGTGHRLPDGALPVFLAARSYNYMKFSVLNLPQSFTQVQ